jgi:hypothetical protein
MMLDNESGFVPVKRGVKPQHVENTMGMHIKAALNKKKESVFVQMRMCEPSNFDTNDACSDFDSCTDLFY